MNKYPITIFDYIANMDFVDYLSMLFTILILLSYVGGILYLVYKWISERGTEREEIQEESERLRAREEMSY